MGRRILKDLHSREYEHEFDRTALESLEKTPGLETLVRKFNKNWNDKIFKIQITGSFIKVTDKNFPKVYSALIECCKVLNMNKVPKLYIQWGYSVNAYTAGVEDPIIVLNSGCIELLSHEELLYVLGHELGHIKSEHILYSQMAQVFPVIGQIIGSATLGIGNLISKGIEIALLNWARMSEFTADRAGLLACQNVNAAIRVTAKTAGLPEKFYNSEEYIEEFIKQAEEFESFDYDSVDKAAKLFSTIFKTHPWSVMRASELLKWIETDEYKNTFNRNNLNIDKFIIICDKCGAMMKLPKGLGAVKATCPKCSEKVSTRT